MSAPEANPARPAPPAVIAHATPAYRLGTATVRTYLTLFHRLAKEGVEHLPRTGGVLVVANHQSFLDIPMIAAAAPRHVAFVARASLENSRFLKWLMRESGVVLIRPNTPDRAALEAMIAHLEAGDCVAVFPEGTRTRDGSLGAFRAGAAVAARRARVPIVPACIQGAFEAWPRHRALPVPRQVRVRFGEPLAHDVPDAMEVARQRIQALLPFGSPG